MCSRRIFEIIASGSTVVTTPSAAIGTHFDPDEIFTVTTEEEAEHLLRALHRNPELGERQLHRGQRRIWQEHTYRASVGSQQILAAVAPTLSVQDRRPTVSILVSTIRPWSSNTSSRRSDANATSTRNSVLLTHGFTAVNAKTPSRKGGVWRDCCDLADSRGSRSAAGVSQPVVAAAAGDVVTQDRRRRPLRRALPHRPAVRAGLFRRGGGGQTGALHVPRGPECNTASFPEREHRYTRTVMGPTILGSADVFRSSPFAAVGSGEDTRFLRDVVAGGGAVYASDRFNYCQQRASEGHTWKISDAELLASGMLKFFGNYRDQVSV